MSERKGHKEKEGKRSEKENDRKRQEKVSKDYNSSIKSAR